MVHVQSIQPTPNPNAFKFVVDALLWPGTKSVTKAADCKGSPLAEQLFAIDGVDTLFFCDRFVTVSMKPSADWRAVHEATTRVLEDHVSPYSAAGAPGAAPAGAGATAPVGLDAATLPAEARAMLEKINSVLDDRIRPALAGDGGGLEVVGLEGKTLLIRYQGACGSCPSSIGGTLMAIQNLLQAEVDEELAVVSA
ncbi:MAG: NifU family protein [Planctomycetes bacterium]|nr:NifU family protein [Planctomycetota bacterium]